MTTRMVGKRGFEPPAPASRTLCSTRLSHFPTFAKLSGAYLASPNMASLLTPQDRPVHHYFRLPLPAKNKSNSRCARPLPVSA